MGEHDIIFIAPINKLNPITRSDKVRLPVNQSISLIYLRFIRFPSASDCSDSQLVSRSSFVNMSSPVWKFFSVAEEGQCHCYLQRMLSKDSERRRKNASSFNKKILYLT